MNGQTEANRREQIEKITVAGAYWGWCKAGGSPSAFPAPLIVWTGGSGGRAQIAGQLNPGTFDDAKARFAEDNA